MKLMKDRQLDNISTLRTWNREGSIIHWPRFFCVYPSDSDWMTSQSGIEIE